MQTDDLIIELAARPWPATRPAIRLGFAMILGWAVAMVGFVLVLGPPMKAVTLTGTTPFALKLGYSLALAIVTAAVALAAGRPGQRVGPRLLLIAVPVAVVATAAVLELKSAPPTSWRDLLFGSTSLTCITAISIASVPVFIAVMWAFKALAPTRLTLAGMVSGMSAGAAGAVAYALYCKETTAAFLLASYTPGILIPALIGALLGSRLLRW